MTATKTSASLAASLVIHLHLKRLRCEGKLPCGVQFFPKYFDVGVKKQSKAKQKKKRHVQLVPPAIGSVLHVSHRLVFLSHWDLIDCEHMDSYNTKRKECRVSAPRLGFMFGITRLLFTACSALAYTRTNL